MDLDEEAEDLDALAELERMEEGSDDDFEAEDEVSKKRSIPISRPKSLPFY